MMLTGCKNKELSYEYAANTDRLKVKVLFHWDSPQEKPKEGNRINLFSLNQLEGYGVDDVPTDSAIISLQRETVCTTLSYTYQSNNLLFRNETNIETIAATCEPTTRSTYSRSFPNETTVSGVTGTFHTATNEYFDLQASAVNPVIHLYPQNRLITYSFEVRNVEGAENIIQTRAALSGMATTYYIGRDEVEQTPTTVLFDAEVDMEEGRIYGQFQSFGKLPDIENNLTLEVLYPSSSGGIGQYTWDVSSQFTNTNRHAIIEESEVVIPNEGGGEQGGSSSFEVDLEEWESETVPLS